MNVPYNVPVKYNRKNRVIKVSPLMTFIEFQAICKHEFDIEYAMFFTIGGERRLDLCLKNRKTNDRIRFGEMGSVIGTTLKGISIELMLIC